MLYEEEGQLVDIILYSPIKINLILKISERRSDGYHNIYSLFWKKKASERLTIREDCAEIIADRLIIEGMEIPGENLLLRALAALRKSGSAIPPLEIRLKKELPMGSGIGAGSGNAAALLDWLSARYGAALSQQGIAKLGADVGFLASGLEMAEARGTGEILSDAGKAPELSWLLVFPRWSSETALAYRKLDELRQGQEKRPAQRAEKKWSGEAEELLRKLSQGTKVGRLPNDFFELLAAKHPEYLRAEELASAAGAPAWGLCGSGSAFFILGDKELLREAEYSFAAEPWAAQTKIII